MDKQHTPRYSIKLIAANMRLYELRRQNKARKELSKRPIQPVPNGRGRASR